MIEMIERVARALCWKSGRCPDLTLGGDGENFLWHEYENQARAAIDAMREPTQEMANAGDRAIDALRDPVFEDTTSYARVAWKAMIAAALKNFGEAAE